MDLVARSLSDNHTWKVGITSGCFDIWHYYHLAYLRRCKRHCGILIVGIDSDDLVRETKGINRPIFSEHRRAEIVDSIRYVDYTFIMNDPYDLAVVSERLCPDIMFKNDAFEDMPTEEVCGAKYCADGVKIIRDFEDYKSTSEVIKSILGKG